MASADEVIATLDGISSAVDEAQLRRLDLAVQLTAVLSHLAQIAPAVERRDRRSSVM